MDRKTKMKKGMKLVLQIIGILLVVALIGGGIYWLVAHNTNTVLANSGFEGGRHGGGMESMRPGGDFSGALPEGGFEGRGGHDGINLASGLAGVGRIVLEIGVVTLGVLLVQWLIRKVRKPKAAAPVTVVTSAASVDTSANPVETLVETQDLFPPSDEESQKTE
jgi:hypothetical protein